MWLLEEGKVFQQGFLCPGGRQLLECLPCGSVKYFIFAKKECILGDRTVNTLILFVEGHDLAVCSTTACLPPLNNGLQAFWININCEKSRVFWQRSRLISISHQLRGDTCGIRGLASPVLPAFNTLTSCLHYSFLRASDVVNIDQWRMRRSQCKQMETGL